MKAGAWMLVLPALLVFGCAPSIKLQSLAIPPSAASLPVARQEPWWIQRHEAICSAPKEGVSLVFLGNSITQGWEANGHSIWEHRYAPHGALNMGISGDRTQHVLWRIDDGAFEGLQPDVIVLHIGTNNSADDPPKEIADGVMAIVQRLRDRCPQSRVLMLGIFPRGADSDDPRRRACAQATRQFARAADGEHVFFLDIRDAFLQDDGAISPQVMPDYLHLSEQGYERWAEAMAPALAQLLE